MPLYLISTPIGNLEDLSPRALRLLREAELIAAEDTRVTRKLLSHFDVHTPLTSYHAHSGARKAEALVERLREGAAIALVSDAGTPGISDPGGALVREALEAGVEVVPIPGPSAVLSAVVGSGLDPSRFVFEGFLPRSGGDRGRCLDTLRPLPHTLVFYEAPDRLTATLAHLREALGDRPAAVARELTKKFEEFVRGPLSGVEAHFRETAPRGECVIVVAGRGPDEPEPAAAPDLDTRLRELLTAGATVRDAARTASEELRRSRKETYARALELTEETR